jgi:uncharacterized RDD family membrane protein YckC
VSPIAPGWYKDPAEPTTQRYWDGEGWLGDPLPADATPPPGPPPPSKPPSAPVSPVWSSAGTDAPARPTSAAPTGPAPVAPADPPPGLPPLPPGYRWVRAGPSQPRPHGFPVANPGLRLAARAIDITLLLLLNVIVNGWFAVRWWQATWPYYTEVMRRLQTNQPANDVPQQPQSGTLQIVIILIAMALWFAYEVPAIANNGQTPGKRLVGIRVLRLEEDGPLGFARSIRRWNPMGLGMFLWQCCFIGFVFQFVDCLFVALDQPLHQALHDKSAGTVVVKTGRVPLRQRGTDPTAESTAEATANRREGPDDQADSRRS